MTLDGQPATGSHFQYASVNGDADDLITIPSTDPQYMASACNPANANGSASCMVRIGVVAFSEFTYYVVLATAGNPTLLLNGVSQTSTANASVFTQFVFESRSDGVEIDFVLTPLSGDPDMYISTSEDANATNHQWVSQGLGTEVVQVFADDPNRCTAPCRYYIGVTGFGGQAQFTITAYLVNSQPLTLRDGLPQVRMFLLFRILFIYGD